jgi:hypothetical protein
LYWGYINRRLDWAALRFLLDAGVRIYFVGPMTGGQEVHNLLQHPNASYYGIGDLDAFPQVLAQCACSILPYDLRLKTDVTIGNRSFHLLSYGLPLLFAKMPGLIEAPDEVIHPCLTPSDYLKAYQLAKEQFYTSQDSIARFLNGHSEQNRYQQLMEHVERVRKTRTAQRMRH